MEMQKRVSAAYARAAEKTATRVARVGDAFQWVIVNNPQIQLFDSDFEHPSACGSYLIACVFVSLLTGKDPSLLDWIPAKGVTAEEARVLRSASKNFSRN